MTPQRIKERKELLKDKMQWNVPDYQFETDLIKAYEEIEADNIEQGNLNIAFVGDNLLLTCEVKKLKADHTALQRKHEDALKEVEKLKYDGNVLQVFYNQSIDLGSKRVKKIENANAIIVKANKKLNNIASLCGNPDASEACRLILKEIQE